jgi:hypothetical protein
MIYIWIFSRESELNNKFEYKKQSLKSKATNLSFRLESILEEKLILIENH